ncbi:MAG TPA: orotidine-5'-phosphate decarboxylase [Cyclobacteriaceae bacterium]|nr:orotidine-5'-phosphate decarboxylase [Cyclobacteriaceae bacterium]
MENLTWDLKDPRNRIIVALDGFLTLQEVEAYVILLKDYVWGFKVGFQLIHTLGGPQVVWLIKKLGGRVFYDCKLKDTKDTMRFAAEGIAKLEVEIFNLHADSTVKAMKAVQEICGNSIVAGVTVLTSLSEDDCQHVYKGNIEDTVERFATDIITAGLPAVICSAKEAEMLKNIIRFKDLFTITPGIRPRESDTNDQDPDRVRTPYEAIMGGSDMEVIGRPILKPDTGTPVEAAIAIANEIQRALNDKAA